VLVDDVAIAKLNARYHDTPGATDILSFDYGEEQGELIISVEHAVTQARRYHTTTPRELILYVVHGSSTSTGQRPHTASAPTDARSGAAAGVAITQAI